MQTDSNEFEAVAITDDQLVAWPRVAAIAAMVAFSLPSFQAGLDMSAGLSPANTLTALITGSFILVIIGSVMGAIGAKSRMSSYLLVRIAFGDKGAGVVNIAFAISLLGWFGVNINFFMGALGDLGWPPLIAAIVGSICMTVTTLVGFKAINMFSVLLVPVLAIVTFLFAYTALKSQSVGEIMSSEITETLTTGEGISAIVGTIIVGAIILPDITRFVRHWSGAIYIATIAYLVVQVLVMGAAAMVGFTSGETDILKIMLGINLGFVAFIIIIAGSWILNSLNLYSTVLSTKATFPKLNTKGLTIALGAIGVIAGLMNILDNFIMFLIYLSAIFIPVAGVLIVDALIIRPNAYKINTLDNNRALNLKAFFAWAPTTTYAIAVEAGILSSPTSVSAIDALVLAAFIYLILSWTDRKKMVGAAVPIPMR